MGFFLLMLATGLVLGFAQANAAKPVQPVPPPTPTGGAWADDLSRLKAKDPAFAATIDDALRTGNPYYLAQYVPFLTYQGYNYPTLASYLSSLVVQNSAPVQSKSGLKWRVWGFVPTSPVYFDTPDQRLRVSPGEPIAYVLTDETPPKPVIAYVQIDPQAPRRALGNIAPGLTIASQVVQYALSGFNVVDRTLYAQGPVEDYGHRFQET